MITQTNPNNTLTTQEIEAHLSQAINEYKGLLPQGSPVGTLFDSWIPVSGQTTSTTSKELLCAQLRVVGRLIKELYLGPGVCPDNMEECDGGCVPIGSCC